MQLLEFLRGALAYFLMVGIGLSMVVTGPALTVLLAVTAIAAYAVHKLMLRHAARASLALIEQLISPAPTAAPQSSLAHIQPTDPIVLDQSAVIE